jgi:proteasome accessory factor B
MAARRTERLLEVVLCLSQTRTYVTKAQLRDAIEDYAQSPNDVAFERTFERDKADLRDLGVPLETLGDSGDEGYRIDLASAALPVVTFTPDEAAVLALARRIWHTDGAAAADRALRKLEAGGVAVDGGALAAVEPRLIGGEQAYAPLAEAASRRHEVRFDHRRSGSLEVLSRRLQPWGLLSRSGRWYVVGHDLERDAPRAFRLDRIVGPVTAHGPDDAYVRPPEIDVTSLLGTTRSPSVGGEAVLLVRAERAFELRERASDLTPSPDHPGFDRVTLTYSDPDRLVHQVLEHASDVRVLEPVGVRDSVVDRLTSLSRGA